MAKVGTLITYPNYYRGQKALITGTLSGAAFDVKLVSDDVSPDAIGDSSTKLPVLRMNDEKTLFDSNAICFLLGNDSLRGRDVGETTEVLEWMQFADQELLPPLCAWVFPVIGVLKSDVKSVEQAKEDCLKILKVLDQHLLFRTFVLGDRLTLADVSLFCNLTFAYKHVFFESLRRPFVCLNRWFKTLQNNAAFRQHVGEIRWCEKEAKLDDGKARVKEESKDKPKKSKAPGATSVAPAVPSAPAAPATSEKRPFMKTKEELISKLKSMSIECLRIDHRHVNTVEELMPELGELPRPGVVGKNLFLKDKKTKKLYLLTTRWDRAVKLKDVAAAVGAKAELRLADESVLLETLGVTQGSVTPYALINDAAGSVTFLLDSVFVPNPSGADVAPLTYFHPLTNDATIGVTKTDLFKFLDHVSHPPTVLEL